MTLISGKEPENNERNDAVVAVVVCSICFDCNVHVVFGPSDNEGRQNLFRTTRLRGHHYCVMSVGKWRAEINPQLSFVELLSFRNVELIVKSSIGNVD